MSYQSCKDDIIVKLLRSEKEEENSRACCMIIDKYGEELTQYMRGQGMTDANEIKSTLNLAIGIFAAKVREGNYKMEKAIVAFIKTVARNKWFDELKKEKGYALIFNKKRGDWDEIDCYIAGELSEDEIFDFTIKLNEDPYLFEEVENRRQQLSFRRLEVTLFENYNFYKAAEDDGVVTDLKRAIRALGSCDRDMIIDVYFRNIALKTYAEVNKLNYDTVKQRHKRCKKRLINIIKNIGDA